MIYNSRALNLHTYIFINYYERNNQCDTIKNFHDEIFFHCSVVAFRGTLNSFTGYLDRFEVS